MPKARIDSHLIHYSITDDYAIVRPEGACNEEATEALARLASSSLIDSKHLVLDLSHADYVETPGYRWIVRRFRELQSDGKSLTVVGLPPSVERAFKLLRLDTTVPTARNVSEALDKINGRRATAVA